MNIETDREKMIYRFEKDGKVVYHIGLSKKNQDNTYTNGYMLCRFPKEADIPDKTKIKIHQAWLDFYLKDKKTNPYIFINKYEIVSETKTEQVEVPDVKSEYDDSGIELSPDDLPF